MKTFYWNKTTIVPRDTQGRIYFFSPDLFRKLYVSREARTFRFFGGEVGYLVDSLFLAQPRYLCWAAIFSLSHWPMYLHH